ncbi:MAG: hypothetical protein IKC21_03775 [Ruminococcus sp.]|nr:hypothetical protein [Ruminococcus sp.]
MKCKNCGAVHEDENLYFCIGCGAMLRNPATGKIVTENREDTIPQDEIKETAETPAPMETTETPASMETAKEILPEPEKPAEEVSEVDKLLRLVEEKKEAVISLEKANEKAEEKAPELPKEDIPAIEEKKPAAEEKAEKLFIEKEREAAFVPPPAENIPPAEENAAVESAEQKPAKVGVGKYFGGFFVALLAGIVLTALCLILSLKLGFTGTNLHNIAKNLDVWSVINAEFNDMSLADNLYYETDFDKATQGNADKTEFTLFLAGTDFTGFCADKLEQYADYIIDGSGDMPTVTNNDIVEFLRANHDSGVGIFGYEMQTADYNAIRSSLDAHKTAEKFSVDKIGWEMKFRLENIGKILSYVTIGILAGVFVLLMIWIAVILKNSKKAIRGYMGNIFTVSGLVVLAAAIAVSAGAALVYAVTGDFLCYLSSTLLLPSAAFGGCFGAFILIVGLIIKKVNSSIKIKDKIQKAAGKVN